MHDRAFDTFLAGVAKAARRDRPPADVVAEVEPVMRSLVARSDWLHPRFRQPIPGRPYAQYLLHLAPDAAFSVVAFVWSPGQGSPVHDHGTWGVIGQVQGEEEETRFRRTPLGPDRVQLEELGRVVFRPGDVSHVYPPDREVHRIRNLGTAPAVSVHVYGGDIGRQPRHTFDPQTGAVRPFVSGYDEPR